MREAMFRWLNGPGNVFRHPLPGSTNYLNAYDRSGNLLRAKDASLEDEKEKGGNRKKDGREEHQDDEGGGADASSMTKNSSRPSRGTKNDRAGLPKETAEDLMPFPLNRQFRSQAVLSEELKDAIFKMVMEDGKSVRDASAALGVEMRRVAAVVRLKAVEKDWETKVRQSLLVSSTCIEFTTISMMRTNIRLVLKTSTLVTNIITTL